VEQSLAGATKPHKVPTSGLNNRGIELDEPSEGRDFGTRMHQLLHERRCRQLGISIHTGKRPLGRLGTETYPEWPDEGIESEAQATLAAYEAHWIKDYEYLESERTSIVDLPERCPTCWSDGLRRADLPDDQQWCALCQRAFTVHQLVVKIDAVVRHDDGTIGPMDTKTESKPGYNSREDWSGRTQAKIYLSALERLYPNERVSRLVVDVVTRRSPKANRQPLFTRLDDIASTPQQLDEALRNVVHVADCIEQNRRVGWWPSNMNVCKKGWEKCDFYPLHVIGRTSENLKKYRPAEKYLEI